MIVHTPDTLRDACRLLNNSDARGAPLIPMAGATDLFVHWPINQPAHDREYLDLSGIHDLRSLTCSATELRLGALATYWQARQTAQVRSDFPLLIEAARQVGAIQIQSRGTWAGNIANGSPAADGVPVMMAYDAVVELVSDAGVRTVPLAEYYTGYRASVRRPDELIRSISIPRRERPFAAFHKVGPRRAQAITKVGVAMVRLAEGEWRIVANSVAPTVTRCRAIEDMLNRAQPVSSPTGFLSAAQADIAPIDDIRSTAEYRLTVFCRLLYYSLVGKCPFVQ